MSFRFIEDHRGDYPVRLICTVLEVSPAGYYAWRKRPVRARVTSDAALLAEIRQVYRESGQRYSGPRVHAILRTQGRGTSRTLKTEFVHHRQYQTRRGPARYLRLHQGLLQSNQTPFRHRIFPSDRDGAKAA